jgi:hypothetical protein
MKPLFTFILSLLTFFSFAQSNPKPVNVKLTGRVISFEADEKPYIYYSLVGKKFTIRNRIKMDSAFKYTFDLSKTIYKNATNGVLVFSLDTTYDMNHKYSCVHRIDLGEINKYAAAKKMKSISLRSDLVMNWMCEASIMEERATENEAYVIGQYNQLVNDTTRTLELKQSAYEFRGSSNVNENDLMNASYGKWAHVSGESAISVFTEYRLNKQFGTMLYTGEKKIYKIGNEKGRMVLVPPIGKSFVREY